MNDVLPSEAGAFRLLQLTAGTGAAATAAAAAGGRPYEVIAVALLTAVVLAWLLLSPREQRARAPRPPRPVGGRHRIVVVATREDIAPLAHDVRERAADQDSDVILVCPALNSRFAYWVSDVDAAELAARHRVEAGVRSLLGAGVDTVGMVGDGDPLRAIEDALWIYGADELVLAPHADDELHWLERRLVERVRARYLMPIVHLVDAHPPEPEPRYVSAPPLAASPALADSRETRPPAG